MKEYIPHKEPIPYLLVKDYFSEEDVNLMMQELQFLTSKDKLRYKPPLNMPDGTKQNNQIGLDLIYYKRNISDILTILNKVYDDVKLINMLKDMSFFYKCWNTTNKDTTTVAYYEDTDYYKSHRDLSVISIMYWLWKEPKSFEGGDIELTDYNIKVPVERNQLMIMPSSTLHAVTSIKMLEDNVEFSGNGRYCIFRFLYIIPTPSPSESSD